jgi:lysophospholipase L1-like esterase
MPKLVVALIVTLVVLAAGCAGLVWKALEWRKGLRALKNEYRDYAGIFVYPAENVRLLKSANRPDVVLIGASHTLAWGDTSSRLPGLRVVNRGVRGQLVPQYLLRFRQDILDLQPRVVVIEGCAINATYDVPLRLLADSYASMAEMARLHDIEPILATTMPVGKDLERRLAGTNDEVRQINEVVRDLARRNGYLMVDYYATVAEPDGTLPAAETSDGMHCSPAIYDQMAVALRPILDRALRSADAADAVPGAGP